MAKPKVSSSSTSKTKLSTSLKSKSSSSKSKSSSKSRPSSSKTNTNKSTSKQGPVKTIRPLSPTSSLLWVDKYKPTSLKSVVGPSGENSNVKKLFRWLQNWYKYHGSSTDKAKAGQSMLKDPDGKTFKVALLSGPPGIGKTTTAQLCCKELGYTCTEMNASDKRNKGALKEYLSDALDNLTLNYSSTSSNQTKKNTSNIKKRHVLIMDEVDGMSGNQDRGGIQELIMLLKTSRIPIICICNDRNSQKIRSLANYCFDLRFKHPSVPDLRSFIQSICSQEGFTIPKPMQLQLIESTDHDIRQILHQMQMFKDVDSSDAKAYNPKKDLQFGPWEVAQKVFSAKEHEGMSIHDKSNLFFYDYSLGPLFVQENYLKCTPIAAQHDDCKVMDLIKATAESLALGDRVENIIRRTTNNWSLLPIQAIFQSVLPGEYMEANCVPNAEFPAWFGKNSNQGKQSRLLRQLHTHMHLSISGSLEALNMEYLPYLRRAIVKPLSMGDVDGAIDYMTNYSLIRDDLDIINEIALWPNMRDLLLNMDAKSKATFTRQLNAKTFVPYTVIKTVTKRGRGAKGDDLDDYGVKDEEDEGELSPESADEKDEIEQDVMIKRKKPRGKAAESKPGSSKNAKLSSSKSTSSPSKSKRRKV